MQQQQQKKKISLVGQRRKIEFRMSLIAKKNRREAEEAANHGEKVVKIKYKNIGKI